MKRKKTKFEKWFSFSRHQRRFGAEKVMSNMREEDLWALKKEIIKDGDFQYTFGSEVSIEAHIENLKKEFVGQSELCHYHASLLVFIRRDIEAEKNFALLESLWATFDEFLLESLNTRWLVSVADTYTEYSDNAAERASALAVTVLANTVKLCETEHLITGCEGVHSENIKPYNLQANRLSLWDGMSAFAVGTDDTLRNFRWRLDDFLSSQGGSLVTARILQTVFSRLQENESIYKRFRDCHYRKRTEWW